jgi:hypothetical protein
MDGETKSLSKLMSRGASLPPPSAKTSDHPLALGHIDDLAETATGTEPRSKQLRLSILACLVAQRVASIAINAQGEMYLDKEPIALRIGHCLAQPCQPSNAEGAAELPEVRSAADVKVP